MRYKNKKGLEVITDCKRRHVIYHWELTEKEKKEFDYYDFSDENVNPTFVRYKGNVIDLGEFMRIDENNLFPGPIKWDGYSSDSFFSGLLVKHPIEEWGEIDMDTVIMGSYFA